LDGFADDSEEDSGCIATHHRQKISRRKPVMIPTRYA